MHHNKECKAGQWGFPLNNNFARSKLPMAKIRSVGRLKDKLCTRNRHLGSSLKVMGECHLCSKV